MNQSILTHNDDDRADVLAIHGKVITHEPGTVWKSGYLVDDKDDYITDEDNNLYCSGKGEA